MSNQHYFVSSVPGYKSLGEITAILKGKVFKYGTLQRRIEHGHAALRRAIKDPNHPRFWIVPDADVNILIDEEKRIRRLRHMGYAISVPSAEKKLGIPEDLLFNRDIGQERILGVWMITNKKFLELKGLGMEAIVALPMLKKDLLAEAGTRKGDKPTVALTDEWLDAWMVRSVPGALRSNTYTDRASAFFRKYQKFPSWAKKENGKWMFRKDYIQADTEYNLKYIGVTETAKLLGCSVRTVINWVDKQIIPSEGRNGAERKILRSVLMPQLSLLKQRLETPANIGIQEKYGHQISQEVIARVRAKQEVVEAARKRKAKILAERERKQKQKLAERAQKREQDLAEKERKRRIALDEKVRKSKQKLEEQREMKKQKLAEESGKIQREVDECISSLAEIASKEDALREEHRCGRVGTLYLGKKPRGEKTIVRELNILHGRHEEGEYNQFRLRLKLSK